MLALFAIIPLISAPMKTVVQDGQSLIHYSLETTANEWRFVVCTPRGTASRLLIRKSVGAATIDMRICPGLDERKARPNDCIEISGIPALTSARTSPTPSILSIGGQKFEFFLEDSRSSTVHDWLADEWSRADSKLVATMALLFSIQVRASLGVPTDALPALMLVPEEFLPTFSKSELKIETGPDAPCR